MPGQIRTGEPATGGSPRAGRRHRRRPTGGLASAVYAGGTTLGASLCVITGHMWVATDTLVGAVVVAWIASRVTPDEENSTARVGAAALILAVPGLVLALGSLLGKGGGTPAAASTPVAATAPAVSPPATPAATPTADATVPATTRASVATRPSVPASGTAPARTTPAPTAPPASHAPAAARPSASPSASASPSVSPSVTPTRDTTRQRATGSGSKRVYVRVGPFRIPITVPAT